MKMQTCKVISRVKTFIIQRQLLFWILRYQRVSSCFHGHKQFRLHRVFHGGLHSSNLDFVPSNTHSSNSNFLSKWDNGKFPGYLNYICRNYTTKDNIQMSGKVTDSSGFNQPIECKTTCNSLKQKNVPFSMSCSKELAGNITDVIKKNKVPNSILIEVKAGDGTLTKPLLKDTYLKYAFIAKYADQEQLRLIIPKRKRHQCDMLWNKTDLPHYYSNMTGSHPITIVDHDVGEYKDYWFLWNYIAMPQISAILNRDVEMFLIVGYRSAHKLTHSYTCGLVPDQMPYLYDKTAILLSCIFETKILMEFSGEDLQYITPSKTGILRKKLSYEKRHKELVVQGFRIKQNQLYLVHMKMKPNLSNVFLNFENLKRFNKFLNLTRKSKDVCLISHLEGLIPSSGLWLIERGYTYNDNCHSLSPEHNLQLYQEMFTWECFQHSMMKEILLRGDAQEVKKTSGRSWISGQN